MNKKLSTLEQEAINENTSPERLKELANFSDISILKLLLKTLILLLICFEN